MSFLSTFAGWVVTAAMAMGMLAPVEPTTLGAVLPQQDALIDTYLTTGIDADSTTMTIADGTTRDGATLTGRYCFTIDINTPTLEYVCGTAAGTTISDLERGVKASNPNETSTDLAFSHRRFATVQVTDFPFNQLVQRKLNGTDSFDAVLSYSNGVTPTGANHIVDKEYVDGVVTGGDLSYDREIQTGNAGETMATGTVAYLNRTDAEWYKADLDVVTSYADVTLGITQGSGTDGNAITGGILTSGLDSNQSGLTAGRLYFLSATAGAMQTATSSQVLGQAKNSTEIIFSTSIIDTYNGYDTEFAGEVTFTGTTNFATSTTFIGDLPAWEIGKQQRILTSTGTSTFAVPVGLQKIFVEVQGGGGGGGGAEPTDSAGAGGGSGGYCVEMVDVSATSTIQYVVGAAGTAGDATGGAGSNGGKGGHSEFGTFCTANGGLGGAQGNTTAGTAVAGGIGGTATGGDININGQAGEGGIKIDSTTAMGYSGGGADSLFGLGGASQVSSAAVAGKAATGYGAGGGGGVDNVAGAGTQGIIIIRW